HEDVNEEWISDKTRHACDGLKRQRLDRPYLRGADGKLKAVSWPEALRAAADKLKAAGGGRVAAIAGDLCDAESMFALKGLMTALGSPHLDCRQDGAKLDARARAGYLFNSGIAGIDRADLILIVGADLRREAPIVNARVRKRYLTGQLKIAAIGPRFEATYPVEWLGAGAQTLAEVAGGRHSIVERLKAAKAPMLILGQGALARADGAAVLALARQAAEAGGMIKDGWNGFNVLHTAAARVAGLDLGFVPGAGGRDVAGILQGCESGEIQVAYLLGADEIDMKRLGRAFVIYQGHHGDAGAHRADLVLPGAAYTEKDGTYVNTEGRAQAARAAAFPPGEAREDWKILRALSETLGKALPFDTLGQLVQAMVKAQPLLGAIDQLQPAPWAPFGTPGAADAAPFASPIKNFYMTDPISRASSVMADCTEAAAKMRAGATGTHG
ncbi:MAG: molybdopterin-dependent oxidoreductase, partial [Alphaproteobacteria bacterium]|nr:molybdopterin-dependent oxidoreductase [Alphaproteobacteria bacterium]